MALFKDKRKKPVNIYAKGSATQKIAEKQFAPVAAAARTSTDIADKYLGGAGTRKMLGAIGRGAKAVAAPVIAGREHQKERMKQIQPFQSPGVNKEGAGAFGVYGAEEQQGTPTVMPQEQTVSTATPTMQRPPGALQEGEGRFTIESTGEGGTIGPDGQIAYTGPDGQPIEALSRRLTNDNQDVGGEARSRFFGAVPTNAYSQNRRIHLGGPAGQVQPEPGQIQPPEVPDYSKLRTPLERRMALKQFRNEMERFEAVSDQNVDMRGQDIRAETAAGSQATLARGQDMRERVGTDRNTIDAGRVMNEKASIDLENQMKQYDLDAAKQLKDIRTRYTNEKNPEKKRALQQQLYALQGKAQQKFQIATAQHTDETGNIVKTPYLIDAVSGQSRTLTGGGGPNDQSDWVDGRPPEPPADQAQAVVGKLYSTGVWNGEMFEQ